MLPVPVDSTCWWRNNQPTLLAQITLLSPFGHRAATRQKPALALQGDPVCVCPAGCVMDGLGRACGTVWGGPGVWGGSGGSAGDYTRYTPLAGAAGRTPPPRLSARPKMSRYLSSLRGYCIRRRTALRSGSRRHYSHDGTRPERAFCNDAPGGKICLPWM